MISALPQQGRKRVHHYKAKLRAYCPNIYTVFCRPGPTHIYLSGSDTKKKSEIETHPPKAARLWYIELVGKQLFSFFASKAKGLSNRQVSVQQLKGLFFSSCCLKKGRCRRRLTATAAMAAVAGVRLAWRRRRSAAAAKLRERAAFPYTFDGGRSEILKKLPYPTPSKAYTRFLGTGINRI